MHEDYIELKTTDHQKVYFRKQSVDAIEEVPEGTRSVAQVKIYSSGYKFTVEGTPEQVFNLLKSQ